MFVLGARAFGDDARVESFAIEVLRFDNVLDFGGLINHVDFEMPPPA